MWTTRIIFGNQNDNCIVQTPSQFRWNQTSISCVSDVLYTQSHTINSKSVYFTQLYWKRVGAVKQASVPLTIHRLLQLALYCKTCSVKQHIWSIVWRYLQSKQPEFALSSTINVIVTTCSFSAVIQPWIVWQLYQLSILLGWHPERVWRTERRNPDASSEGIAKAGNRRYGRTEGKG